jgi:hypothetical protein
MTEDRMSAVAEALAKVVAAVTSRPTDRQGSGLLTCPACQGTLRYGFTRQLQGRHRQMISARCDTSGCVQFSGH